MGGDAKRGLRNAFERMSGGVVDAIGGGVVGQKKKWGRRRERERSGSDLSQKGRWQDPKEPEQHPSILAAIPPQPWACFPIPPAAPPGVVNGAPPHHGTGSPPPPPPPTKLEHQWLSELTCA